MNVNTSSGTARRTTEFRAPITLLGALGLVILVVGSAFTFVGAHIGNGFAGRVVRDIGELGWGDAEANLWSWFSALILALLAAAFAVHTALSRAAGRTAWVHGVLAGVALYLSADEAASLHEYLGAAAGHTVAPLKSGWDTWLIFGVPIAAVAGTAILIIARELARRLRRRLILAGAVYIAGAVGLELVGILLQHAGLSTVSLPYVIEVTLEEGLEMLGVLVALWAVMAEFAVVRQREAWTLSLTSPDALSTGPDR